MASRRRIFIKLCLFLHILEVLLGSVLSVFSFLLQTAAEVGLAETPSWLGIPVSVLSMFFKTICVNLVYPVPVRTRICFLEVT